AWERLTEVRSLMLVPHEPDPGHLQQLAKKLKSKGLSFVRYSELESESRADVLLVDQRGDMAERYSAGRIAYVGGGIRRQVHSIIEPVAHGLPVAIGPHFQRTPEAVTLKAAGSVLSLPKSNASSLLAQWIGQLSRAGELRAKAEEPIRVFLQIHSGAGVKVADFLESCLGETRPEKQESP